MRITINGEGVQLAETDLTHLKELTYQREPNEGYSLTLAKPGEGQMNIIISPKGIRYNPS